MAERLNLLSFKDNMRILHLSWIAFFISFAVWFNHAPLMAALRQNFDQALLAQLDERFADWLAADGKLLAHLDFRDGLTRNEFSSNDRGTQDSMQLCADRERFLLPETRCGDVVEGFNFHFLILA